MRATICGLRRRRQECRIEGRFLAQMPPQQPAAILLGENRACVERIHNQVFHFPRSGKGPHQEVAGEVDALRGGGPAPRADLQVDDGEADRNARGGGRAPRSENCCSRIVVVIAIAAEAQLLVEIRVEHIDRRLRRARVLQAAARRQPLARGGAHGVELSRDTALDRASGHSSFAIISAGVARSRSGMAASLENSVMKTSFIGRAHYRALSAVF